MHRALITGITGQDGSYLAELLLAKGYEVHGLVRRASTFNTHRIDHLYRDRHDVGTRFFLHHGDMTDGTGLRRVLEEARPVELYHLGAQSHVQVSFALPEYTADVGALGSLRLLDAARDHARAGNPLRIFLAGTSEMFGASPPPQNETTTFRPRSPYAIGKLASYWFGVNYREAYNLFVVNGIMFNHESPRRGETFVTRKVTRAVGRIKVGLQDKVYLGNLDARRDWGFAGDYVEGMWLALQQPEPDDYVFATGHAYSIRELLAAAFGYAGLDWHRHVEVESRYTRPTEVDVLCGDASKAKARLGWEPKMDFTTLIRTMVDHDIRLAEKELVLGRAEHSGPVPDGH